MFSAVNEDYLGSGWSRGHMAPAGDNKFSTVGFFSVFLVCIYHLERVKRNLKIMCTVPFALLRLNMISLLMYRPGLGVTSVSS